MDLASYIVMSMLYVFLLVTGFLLFALPAAAIAITLMAVIFSLMKVGVQIWLKLVMHQATRTKESGTEKPEIRPGRKSVSENGTNEDGLVCSDQSLRR